MKDKLVVLLEALNAIEVYGKKNVGTLFNCITHVEGMIAECDKPAEIPAAPMELPVE